MFLSCMQRQSKNYLSDSRYINQAIIDAFRLHLLWGHLLGVSGRILLEFTIPLTIILLLEEFIRGVYYIEETYNYILSLN